MVRPGSRNPNWRGGKASHPLYYIYNEMIARCYRQSHKQYKDYGGRGVLVCEEWKADFWNFVRDMGDRPQGIVKTRARFVLDRIDNNGSYLPSNCRWADTSVSSSNRRESSWNGRGRDTEGRFL